MKISKITTTLISVCFIIYLTFKLLLFGKPLVVLKKTLLHNDKDILSDNNTGIFLVIKSSKLEGAKEGFIALPNASTAWDAKKQVQVDTGIKGGVCWFLAFIQSIIVLDFWNEIRMDLDIIKRHNDHVGITDKFVDEFEKFNSLYFNDEFKEDYGNLFQNYSNFITSVNEFMTPEALEGGYNSATMIGAFFFKLRGYVNHHTLGKLESITSWLIRNNQIPKGKRYWKSISNPDEDGTKEGELIYHNSLFIYEFVKYFEYKTKAELKALTNDALNNKIKDHFSTILNSTVMKKPVELLMVGIGICGGPELLDTYDTLFDDENNNLEWLKSTNFKSILTLEVVSDIKRTYKLVSYNVDVAGHVYACIGDGNGRFINSEGHFRKENKLEYCDEKPVKRFREFIMFYQLQN